MHVIVAPPLSLFYGDKAELDAFIATSTTTTTTTTTITSIPYEYPTGQQYSQTEEQQPIASQPAPKPGKKNYQQIFGNSQQKPRLIGTTDQQEKPVTRKKKLTKANAVTAKQYTDENQEETSVEGMNLPTQRIKPPTTTTTTTTEEPPITTKRRKKKKGRKIESKKSKSKSKKAKKTSKGRKGKVKKKKKQKKTKGKKKEKGRKMSNKKKKKEKKKKNKTKKSKTKGVLLCY